MLQNEFEKYLKSLELSSKTVKNYKSDILHFTSWAILKLKKLGSYVENLAEITPFLSANFASEYKTHMVENRVSSKTVNRRLSTLRQLSKFLLNSQIIDFNFMEGVENLNPNKGNKAGNHPLVEDFATFLKEQNVSKNTIKNYTSDIRQFLSWLENNYGRSN